MSLDDIADGARRDRDACRLQPPRDLAHAEALACEPDDIGDRRRRGSRRASQDVSRSNPIAGAPAGLAWRERRYIFWAPRLTELPRPSLAPISATGATADTVVGMVSETCALIEEDSALSAFNWASARLGVTRRRPAAVRRAVRACQQPETVAG
jgi:hypothetical protein